MICAAIIKFVSDITSQSIAEAFVVQLGDVVHAALDGVLLLLAALHPRGGGLAIALLVDGVHVDVQDDNGDQLDDVADQHGDVGRVVAGLFGALESLRADDVADAVAREEDRGRQLLLGVARDVGADHGQAHGEAQPLEVAEPQADEAAPLVAVGQAHEQAGADDADRVGHDHGDAPRVRPARADDPAAQQADELHRPTRDLEVLRPQRVDVERLDHQRGELSQRRVGDLRARRHDEQDPRLRIPHRLVHLVHLKVSILDPLPVRRHAFGCNHLLRVRQEFRSRGEVREEDQRRNAQRDRDTAKDQEDVHPPWETAFDVSDGVADEAACLKKMVSWRVAPLEVGGRVLKPTLQT